MKFDTELILDRLMKCCNVSEIKDLAKIMGLTQAALSNWKPRGINWNQIFKICESKNIDEKYVIFGIENRDEKLNPIHDGSNKLSSNDSNKSLLEMLILIKKQLDKQEETNKKFLEIPQKVEAIEKQITEIHDRITEGNNSFDAYTKKVIAHSQNAKEMAWKILSKKKPGTLPFQPPKNNA